MASHRLMSYGHSSPTPPRLSTLNPISIPGISGQTVDPQGALLRPLFRIHDRSTSFQRSLNPTSPNRSFVLGPISAIALSAISFPNSQGGLLNDSRKPTPANVTMLGSMLELIDSSREKQRLNSSECTVSLRSRSR